MGRDTKLNFSACERLLKSAFSLRCVPNSQVLLPPSTRGTRTPWTAAAGRRFYFAPGWPRLRLNSVPLSPCVRCRKSGGMSPQSKAAPHLPSNAFNFCACERLLSVSVEIVASRDDFSERGCVPLRRAVAALWRAAKAGAPAAARRNRRRFLFHSNPLCRSRPLRLVLRTQPRSFGSGSAALRNMRFPFVMC